MKLTKLTKLTLAIAVSGACAALPALAQDRPYYPDDSRAQPNRDYRDSGDWRDRDAYRADDGDRRDDAYRDRDAYRNDDAYRRDDVARVVDTQPIAGSAQREECWNPQTNAYEEVQGPEKAKVLSRDTAIGAVAGGVIGHQFGSHGALATLGGAVLGGLAGHAYEQHQNNEAASNDDLDHSRCRMASNPGERDYNVRYDYRGQEYVARLDHPPGPTLVPGRDIDDDGHPYQEGYWNTR
jgi:uncharacterized protein YcfJ